MIERRLLEWKDIALGSVAVIQIIVGYMYVDIKGAIHTCNNKIEMLQQDKLDKEVYYRDITEIKSGIKELVEWHLQVPPKKLLRGGN